jgi:hypothetical protein
MKGPLISRSLALNTNGAVLLAQALCEVSAAVQIAEILSGISAARPAAK